MVTIVYEACHGGFRQTIFEGERRKSTNNLKKIEELISSLPRTPRLIKYVGNDVKFVYEGNHKVILKNYSKHMDKDLFQQIFATVENKPEIIRINTRNKNKLLRLAAGGVLLLTLTGTAMSLSNTINNSEVPSISIGNSVGREDVALELEENTPVLIDESNYDLTPRLEQTKKILNGEIANNPNIAIGTNLNEYTAKKLSEFINSQEGQYCYHLCEDYGIDPYLFSALLMQESSLQHYDTLPNGKYYNGNGVGICQLENPNGQEITAFNYATNETVTKINTMENACDFESNVEMGIMTFQNTLEKYKGNAFLALQSYNYGKGAVDAIICIYADEIGKSYDEVVNNTNDFGWMKYVQMLHRTPRSFANLINTNKYPELQITADYLKKWSYDTYGDENYICNVLSYYIGIYIRYQLDDNIYEENILTGEVVVTPINTNTHKIS